MPTLPELKAKAKEMGLKGYSKMKKAELEALIAGNTGGAEEVEEVEEVFITTTDILKQLYQLLEGETMEDKAVILGVLFYLNKRYEDGIKIMSYIAKGDELHNIFELGGKVTPERVRVIFDKVGEILRKIEIGDLQADRVEQGFSGVRITLEYEGITKRDGGTKWGRILKGFMKSIQPEVEKKKKEREEEEKMEKEREMMEEEEGRQRRVEDKQKQLRQIKALDDPQDKLEVATRMYNEEFMRVKMAILQHFSNTEFIDKLAEKIVDIPALYLFREGMFKSGAKVSGSPYEATEMIRPILFEIFHEAEVGIRDARNNYQYERAGLVGIS
jgi:hypothetical protein